MKRVAGGNRGGIAPANGIQPRGQECGSRAVGQLINDVFQKGKLISFSGFDNDVSSSNANI